MKKINSPLFCLFLLFFLLPAFPVSVFSSSVPEQRVFDDASLFSSEEILELEQAIQNFQKETKMDFAIVTADDLGGESTRAYADNFYDDHGFGIDNMASGALFLIDMENRLPHISTTGDAIRHLTDSRLQSILDGCYDNLSIGDYAAAALFVVEECGEYCKMEIPSDQYNYDTETGAVSFYEETFPSTKQLFAFGAVAVLAGIIFCVVLVKKYQMKTFHYTYPFRNFGTLSLTEQKDSFLRKNLSKTLIQSNSSSSGSSRSSGSRSSTHSSRSGRSHAGATGRKF